eukprot:scaffold37315_cov58-Phaeocystis_antarctica.AAC.2
MLGRHGSRLVRARALLAQVCRHLDAFARAALSCAAVCSTVNREVKLASASFPRDFQLRGKLHTRSLGRFLPERFCPASRRWTNSMEREKMVRWKCEHGRQRTKCKDCGGGIKKCEHGRERSKCKDCGGSGICEHGRQRS